MAGKAPRHPWHIRGGDRVDSKSEVLFEGPYGPESPARFARSYAVAPDGRRFLMMKEEGDAATRLMPLRLS